MTHSVPGDGIFNGGQGRQVRPLVFQKLDFRLLVVSEACSGLFRASRGLTGGQTEGGGRGARTLYPDAGDARFCWHGDEVVGESQRKQGQGQLNAVKAGAVCALWPMFEMIVTERERERKKIIAYCTTLPSLEMKLKSFPFFSVLPFHPKLCKIPFLDSC